MMTPQEQRIALAEWDGWKRVETTEQVMHWPGGMLPTKVVRWCQKLIKFGKEKFPLGVIEEDELPDYPSDLNAVHELEKKLDPFMPENTDETGEQWNHYCDTLQEICEERSDPRRCYINATAAQRCEALCRVLFSERWKD